MIGMTELKLIEAIGEGDVVPRNPSWSALRCKKRWILINGTC